MLFERPYTRLTRARLAGLAIGSLPEKPSSLSNPPTPSSSSSSSAPSISSASSTPSFAPDTLPQTTGDAPDNQQQQKQQRQQRKQPRKQKQPKQQQPKQGPKDKNADVSAIPPPPPHFPSPEPTKVTTASLVDPASDDTADTADIAPNTPEYSSSSEPSRPVVIGQERTRGAAAGGGATSMLEVDTHSHHYSPSPYRTPTWSPESTSNQQADVALQELLGRNHQEEGRSIDAAGAQDSLLSPLSLLSAVASVVGNRIGSPGLSNLEDLATCESLRSLSAAAPATNPSLNSLTTINQDAAMAYASHEQGYSSSVASVLPQDSVSSSSITTTPSPRLPPTTITATTGLAPIPRKRGRPPKNSNLAHYSSMDVGRSAKLSAIAPRPTLDNMTQMSSSQRSDTPGSTSSSSSLRHATFENRLIMPMGNTAATTVQTRNDYGQPVMQSSVRVVRVTPPNPTPRLKHNRKPNPDGAIWSAAELAAETSAERRPARAIVYADEHIKQLVEGKRICIMEPCFKMPVRDDLYCLGLPDDETGHRHEHGGICIQEKASCRIVLAFRYRYQLRLDTTYLAWVSTIDMATIPVSVLKDFSANREVMRQALEGEERMSEQYRQLSDAGYFTPPRKEDKRNQDNNPSVTLDGWSIAHQNNVLMASMSNRFGFLQWVAQAFQMAIAESRNPVVIKTVPAKKPIENRFKRELRLALNKKMKLN